MSPAFEGYLARLYTDDAERAVFLADPRGRATAAGLSPPESGALAAIDRDGLLLAAASFQKKRTHAGTHGPEASRPGLRRVWGLFGRARAGRSARASRGRRASG